MTWKGLFQHFEQLPMDDWHTHDIEERWLYQLPNYVFITHNIMVPTPILISSVTLTTYNNNLAYGSGNDNGNEVIRSGIAIESISISPSTKLIVYYQHSTILWNSFENYIRITKQFKWKNYKINKDSNINHMKAYKRSMHKCICWS
jgi:hypothetical protein